MVVRPYGWAIQELTLNLPFLVFKNRGLDPSRILLPTAGGPDSDLSAETAKAFRDYYGTDISILHVVDEEIDHANAMAFIGQWADHHGLGDAELIVSTNGDIQGSIRSAAADHLLVLIGATERGLLMRLLGDSLVFQVVDEIDQSVLLAERSAKRSLWKRLFGRSSASTYSTTPDEQSEPAD